MIERYLAALDAELHVPRRARARILTEVRDHLEEGAERGAVDAFGNPRELAAQFHEQLASASARRAGVWTAMLMVLLVVGSLLGKSPFVFFGAQLAAVAGGLGLVRWWRYRDSGVPAERLADLYRANGLAVACVAVVGLAERGAVGAVLLVASLVVGLSLARSRARARVVKAEAPHDDALDDVAAVVPLVPVRQLGSPLRTHPWLFCLAFATACGLALAAQHAVMEGGLVIGGRQALAALIIASIEAATVIACFAMFGRLLGIRR